MTLVKVCGLTSELDIASAGDADLLGFVVMTGTRRSLDICKATSLLTLTDKPRITVTTLTDPIAIIGIANTLRPDAIQLNGPIEPVAFRKVASSVSCEVWLAVHIGLDGAAVDKAMTDLADCVVLDTATPQGGGMGRTHDWNESAKVRRELKGKKVALAGGLRPENVEEAIMLVRPDIVDVSSGVESDGMKDPLKIQQFVKKVRSCK